MRSPLNTRRKLNIPKTSRTVFCTFNLRSVPGGKTIFHIHTEYEDLKKNQRKSLHLTRMQENPKQEKVSRYISVLNNFGEVSRSICDKLKSY